MTKSERDELMARLFPATIGARKKAEAKAERIMREAVNNPDLIDAIQERACFRHEAGYSDSLYMAVLSNLIDTGETREYSDTPDEKQAAFLRRMGFVEADIMSREKCPSVWIKRKQITDWEVEKQKYRQ